MMKTPHSGPLPIGSADSADAERVKCSPRLGKAATETVLWRGAPAILSDRELSQLAALRDDERVVYFNGCLHGHTLRIGTIRGPISPGTPQRGVPTLAQSAFTRLDLMVLVVVVALLLSWLGFIFLGEHGRTARCAANLKVLGEAMQNFGNEHNGAIPPALAAGQQTVIWDAQLAPYLPRSLVKNGIEPVFRCPSDQLPHARARSYSMPAHDMRSENWPLGPQTATGVGLVWYPERIGRLLGDDAIRAAQTNIDFLAMVKPSMMPSPAHTLVLTELINSDNNLKGVNWSYLDGPGQQLEQLLRGTRIHHGRYNYLMADGHVELMSPLQAGDSDETMNIWSIRKAN